MNTFQAAAVFPFADADFSRTWAYFRLPTFRLDRLLEAQRKNAAALTSANQAALDGFATLAHRQGDLFTTTVEECRKAVSDVMAAGSFEDKATRQADAARHFCEAGVVRYRELFDIAAKANVTAADILSARVTEAFDELRALLAAPAEPAPAPSAVPIPVLAAPVAQAVEPVVAAVEPVAEAVEAAAEAVEPVLDVQGTAVIEEPSAPIEPEPPVKPTPTPPSRRPARRPSSRT